VTLRHRDAVRPWQHVLDPLAGYLALAGRLLGPDGDRYARAWNFGPVVADADDATVGQVAERVALHWGDGARVEHGAQPTEVEAQLLRLDSTDARTEIGWRPRWSLDQAIEQTVGWHRAWLRGDDMLAVSRAQLAEHSRAVPA
jgi:CDP-glucose 4,6-dehydratase